MAGTGRAPGRVPGQPRGLEGSPAACIRVALVLDSRDPGEECVVRGGHGAPAEPLGVCPESTNAVLARGIRAGDRGQGTAKDLGERADFVLAGAPRVEEAAALLAFEVGQELRIGEVVGQHGLLVPAERPDALRAAVDDALTRAWDRGALAAWGRRRSWHDVGREVAEVYEEAVNHG